MNCGNELKPYELYCNSCGMKKSVPLISVILNNDYVVTDRVSSQHEFSNTVKNVFMRRGGDTSHVQEGIVGCPECLNYFHYLTQDFINTHRCPHCGEYFEFSARIYEEKRNVKRDNNKYMDEWDIEGFTYDEWMEMMSLEIS